MEWQPIETAPRDEMFIWARPKVRGKWGLGLAYRNVSGGWSDAYGAPTHDATHWMPLPAPPDDKQVGILRQQNEPKTNTTGDEG